VIKKITIYENIWPISSIPLAADDQRQNDQRYGGRQVWATFFPANIILFYLFSTG